LPSSLSALVTRSGVATRVHLGHRNAAGVAEARDDFVDRAPRLTEQVLIRFDAFVSACVRGPT
jgi:hypothetical protein